MIAGIGESKLLINCISCNCRCTSDGKKCNAKQKCNNDRFQCECKNQINHRVCKEDYRSNPTT